MHTKKFGKRLNLNKKTIADLSKNAMRGVYGGHDSSPTCPYYTQWDTCFPCEPPEKTIPYTDCQCPVTDGCSGITTPC